MAAVSPANCFRTDELALDRVSASIELENTKSVVFHSFKHGAHFALISIALFKIIMAASSARAEGSSAAAPSIARLLPLGEALRARSRVSCTSNAAPQMHRPYAPTTALFDPCRAY